jgi:multidrug efflux pump subunit AcrA (membrane-fusion protein)
VGIVRKWVFPILRIVIFTAIAVALVKVAFFADAEPANPDVPSAEIVEPQIAVSLGTIQNDVSLSGTIAADAAVPIKATLAGEVRKLLVTPGQHVDAGTPVLTLRAEVPSADGTTISIKTATVTSPAAGTLSDFPALVGQMYSVGDDIGKVAPPTFHVSGSLAPEQLYRLSVQPTDAQVVITGGPAPFTCTGLVISTPLAGQGGSDGATGPTVTCAIPAEITVFPGLTAQIVIAGGVAENVLTVPTTAVEGIAESGNVYFVLPDGSTELRPVTLGLNDGFNVEVKEGLAEGDLVLQYVPGAVAVDPGTGDPGSGFPISECVTDKDGNVIGCGG